MSIISLRHQSIICFSVLCTLGLFASGVSAQYGGSGGMSGGRKGLLDMRIPSIVAPRFVNPKCQQLGY